MGEAVIKAVPIVDVLGGAQAHQDIHDIKELLMTTNSLLTDIKNGLEHVKIDSFVDVRVMDELGDLPIPSTVATGLLVSAFASGGPTLSVDVINPYLNVVVNNSSGTGAIPASSIDGLKTYNPSVQRVEVTAQPIAVSGTVNVGNVVDVSGSSVTIANTISDRVPVSLDTTQQIPVIPYLRDPISGNFYNQLGYWTNRTYYIRGGTEEIGTVAGVTNLACVGGVADENTAYRFVSSTGDYQSSPTVAKAGNYVRPTSP